MIVTKIKFFGYKYYYFIGAGRVSGGEEFEEGNNNNKIKRQKVEHPVLLHLRSLHFFWR
jgi:hypothetical protein